MVVTISIIYNKYFLLQNMTLWLRISEYNYLTFDFCWTNTAIKARLLENCFPTYVFVFRQMCLFEGLNTMGMGITEIHSWGVEVLEVLIQFLISLCDGLNATCFSLLCVGSFSMIYNKQQSYVREIRNLLIFQEIRERSVVIWLLLMKRELQRKSYCVS